MNKTSSRAGLYVVPVGFRAACAFVADWRRHLGPPRGAKFCLGVACDRADGPVLVGVAIVGRPMSRAFDDRGTVEVTDGSRNANSLLYVARTLGNPRGQPMSRPRPGTAVPAPVGVLIAQADARGLPIADETVDLS